MKKVNKLALCLGLIGIGSVASPVYAEEGAEIEISGAVEVEFGIADGFDDSKESGAALATVEIGFDAEINEMVTTHILLLHEDGDTEPPEVDEGTITIANPGGGLYFTGGRMYVPFGVFESNMVSDPLTLEIAETREAAVQFGFDGMVSASITLFNGDTIETPSAAAPNDDELDQYVLNIGYAMETDDMSVDIGLGIISSMGESDGLFGVLDETVGGELTEYVGGTAFHANYSNGPFNVFTEFVASDQFNAAEIDFNGVGAEPSAYNIEFGYSFGESTVALAFTGTAEALALDLPETRVAVAYSTQVFEGASFAAELASDTDYDLVDGGTGESASTITLQVAVEF